MSDGLWCASALRAIAVAARHKHDNPDGYLNRLADDRCDNLKAWAEQLSGTDPDDALLGRGCVNPIPVGSTAE